MLPFAVVYFTSVAYVVYIFLSFHSAKLIVQVQSAVIQFCNTFYHDVSAVIASVAHCIVRQHYCVLSLKGFVVTEICIHILYITVYLKIIYDTFGI